MKKMIKQHAGTESSKLIKKIIRIIRRDGIPKYIKHWSPPSEIPKHFENDSEMLLWINRNVLQPYHKHSFVFANQPNTKKIKTHVDKVLLRRPPNVFWDSRNKIGRIEYFRFKKLGSKSEIASDTAKLVRLVKQNLKTWKQLGMRGLIIDLRKHYGGSMWPFVESLRQDVIGDASLLAWTNTKISKTKKKWINSSKNLDKFNGDLKMKLPIAIIIGPDTTSSGEISAAIFKGRINSKSFGQRTSGFLSANATIKLDKKYILILTVKLTQTADMQFGDEFLRPDKKTTRPITDAKTWILSNT